MGLFGLGNRIDINLLSDTPIFRGFSYDEMKAIAKLAKRRDVPEGEIFIEQGRFGDACFVISEGIATVYSSDVRITSVTAGTAVGEMALLERRPRNATVVAETDLVLVELAIEDFRKLLDQYPAARLRIEELLNKRLHENQQREENEPGE